VKVFYERDADLGVLKGRTIAMIGYGNQGRAQALNLRDSGLDLVIGNIDDDYRHRAIDDGFRPVSIADAASQGDIIMLVIPDEVQDLVYQESIAAHLKPGKTISFASGYNVHFGLISPPNDVDVIMVAPRTIGRQVRIAFEGGGGVNADVDVRNDATGNAWPVTLALAKGIGCTRAGAFHTSFGTEAELDLFAEQGLWPAIFECLLTAFEVLESHGYPKEAIALELYASAEPADIFLAMARQGPFRQMAFHSPTSQYGVLSRRLDATGGNRELRKRMTDALDTIRSGAFAREWTEERRKGYPLLQRLRNEALAHPLNEADRAIRQLLAASQASRNGAG
jgi:ketol-acid reductoisomerase